jgi:eukaryotic-like serine/threonine-protein kinase
VLVIKGTHKGTGAPLGLRSEPGLQPVSLGQNAAHDYNPFGTEPEDPTRVGNVIDGDPNTVWTTATYYEGTLRKPGGVGVGVYLDAAPGVVGRAIEIQTPTPGFAALVYAANHINLEFPYRDPTPLAARGWEGPFAQDSYVRSGDSLHLSDHGAKYRYYLVWLTTLPAQMQSASIAELTLFK